MTTQYEAEINGRVRQLSVQRDQGAFVVAVDGRRCVVDTARIDAHTLSLLVSDLAGSPADARIRLKADPTHHPVGSGSSRTLSYEATVRPDPVTGQTVVHVGGTSVAVVLNGRRRSGRKEEGGHSTSGPQRLVAPMPGKVVRVLVQVGEAVRARQPIVVIEAMKMENELRSTRDGTVTELLVRSGQSVDAGALVAVVAGAVR